MHLQGFPAPDIKRAKLWDSEDNMQMCRYANAQIGLRAFVISTVGEI